MLSTLDHLDHLEFRFEHFLDCIREDRQPLTDGGDGLRVVRVLNAGMESLTRGGAPVSLS